MVLWVWSRVSRHRPSLQYQLPKAQRARKHGERRLRERGSNSRTATNAACFQYFERRGRRILRLFSSLHLVTTITTLSSSEYFPALGHRGKRVFTPRSQLIPSFHVLICPLQPAAPTTGLHKLDDAVPCTEVPARTLRTSSACQSIIETLVPGRPQALACAPTFWCPLFLCF